jgi:hypothetical protein
MKYRGTKSQFFLLVSCLLTLLSAYGGGGSSTPDAEGPAQTVDGGATQTPDTTTPRAAMLVSASSAAMTVADISWEASIDDQTPADQMTYQVHLSKTENFVARDATQFSQFQGVSNASLVGLIADTRYFVKLVSVDLSGNNSIFNEGEIS